MVRLIAWFWLGFELGYHRDLTSRASASFSPDARRLVINANLYVDMKTAAALLFRRRSSPLYRQHFDDCVSLEDHIGRWQETEERLIGVAQLGSSRSDTRELAIRLGGVHHSGQDYYAHSNHVELLAMNGESKPATHADVMNEPGLESVRTAWRGAGLISGAYFEDPPIVEGLEIHHRTLNKDKPAVLGEYVYAGRHDRGDMHRRAMECAARESDRLNDVARGRHPAAYAGLADYQSGLIEGVVERLRYGFAVFAAAVSGHWR